MYAVAHRRASISKNPAAVPAAMALFAGVHGLRPRGWIVVTVQDDHLHELSFRPTFDAVLEAVAEADRVGIDLPLVHDDPDGTRGDGWRSFDAHVHAKLGEDAHRAPAWPPDIVFAAPTLEAAVAEAEDRGWPVPNRLQWAVRDKIQRLRTHVTDDDRWVEVCPEAAFLELAQGRLGRDRVRYSKTSMGGIAERLELLHVVGLRPTRSFGGIGGIEPKPIVDATVCAWVAREGVR